MDARSSKVLADSVLDTVPSVMQFIRVEMRRHGARGISVPQFRVLNFLGRHPGGSLSDAAERVGLSLPATSRLVDGLVDRGLLSRGQSSLDRRRVALQLTARGQELLRTARAGAQAALADTLAALPMEKRARVVEAMEALRGHGLPSWRSRAIGVRPANAGIPQAFTFAHPSRGRGFVGGDRWVANVWPTTT